MRKTRSARGRRLTVGATDVESEVSEKRPDVFRLRTADRAATLQSITQARTILIPRGSPGTFHRVWRCARRAFLCGEDRRAGRLFQHRRQWVEDRIHEFAGIFGVANWGYAVMSKHLHVVVKTLPEAVAP